MCCEPRLIAFPASLDPGVEATAVPGFSQELTKRMPREPVGGGYDGVKAVPLLGSISERESFGERSERFLASVREDLLQPAEVCLF